ncbi:MAG: hypothetical protein LBD85_00590, partial [Oscillospiraceae bacterium]|nr:hypothetical protein [Oscillospiraceae bacterium]
MQELSDHHGSGVSRLFAQYARRSRNCAAIAEDGGRRESLFAYYSRAALPLAETAIADADPKMYKLQRILQQLNTN